MSLNSLLSGAALALTLAAPALADIEIHHAYARSSNPMAGAAFMVIHNTGDTDDHLIDVTSDVAARTELHTHLESSDGVMQMIHVEEGFPLPAGGTITMKRGGEHVMFMGLKDPFEQDGNLSVTFVFKIAGEITVDIPVDQNRAPMAEMDHSTMDHSDHEGMDHSDP